MESVTMDNNEDSRNDGGGRRRARRGQQYEYERIRKIFWTAKPGDRIALVTTNGLGGLFTVDSREATRGPGATIKLSLRRTSKDGKSYRLVISSRHHMEQIILMSFVRDKKEAA